MTLRLHGYWRSSAAYRVRLALALKELDYDQHPHDLRTGAQGAPDYLALNPQGLVPALETDDGVLVQSPAILEWLEESHPRPPLLPTAARDRAVVRAMAATISCDVHSLNNLRVLQRLRGELGADAEQVKAWIGHWIATSFVALEVMITRHGAEFAFGDAPTLADCYLVPQVYSAERFAVDLSSYPHLTRAAATLRALPQAAAAHPDAQPDADPA